MDIRVEKKAHNRATANLLAFFVSLSIRFALFLTKVKVELLTFEMNAIGRSISMEISMKSNSMTIRLKKNGTKLKAFGVFYGVVCVI